MFQKLSNSVLIVLMSAALSACSGGQEPFETPLAALAAEPTPIAPAIVAAVPEMTLASTGVSANIPAGLQPQQRVSASERVAEELRLVDYEQSFSIEMNRRAQEQAEREQRAAVSARAGVVQGPGCEGTEGHAALECERSII